MRRLATTDAGFAPAFETLLGEARETTERVDQTVAAIIADVRARGDAAVIDYTQQFDRHFLTAATLPVSAAEIARAVASIAAPLMAALELAASRIEAFHRAQLPSDLRMTDEAGLTLGLRWGALDSVGLYVPGGKAAYPSSVLMNALPARVAGVERIAMCVPCPDGVLNPLVLAAADLREFPRSTASAARRRWRQWLTARQASPRWTASSAPATPMSRRPSDRCSAESGSTTSPDRPRC